MAFSIRPFALVALCEASTCLKKKTHGSLLHLCEQAGKQIPIIYQFSIIATMFKCEGPHIQPDAHNRSHLWSTRCRRSFGSRHQIPSQHFLPCVSEDLKIELEVATDTKATPKQHQRKLPGAQECIYRLQVSVITSEFPYSLVESKVSFALASLGCGLNVKAQWPPLPGPMFTHFLDEPQIHNLQRKSGSDSHCPCWVCIGT